ncbi:hypothetical protein [Rhodococcus rhodochrous]|uniref:Uncharacterized protein n=1 Tax=Rhodococcus rhodochrous TaxID=1829 RepID=A0AA47A2M9_RHORH|nr:hypothetical protein [Rhodococcus rhodochrous]UZF43194.1 hypothetical protein KUM34_014870 [Rhodococcus rhodochrous]
MNVPTDGDALRAYSIVANSFRKDIATVNYLLEQADSPLDVVYGILGVINEIIEVSPHQEQILQALDEQIAEMGAQL